MALNALTGNCRENLRTTYVSLKEWYVSILVPQRLRTEEISGDVLDDLTQGERQSRAGLAP